jgi:hypothetical protein
VTAIPVPVRETVAVLPLVELLLIVSCPVRAPEVVGSNCSFSVRLWLGFSVAGKLPPMMVKPAPAIVAELTVTGVVPVEVKVTDCVVAVFTATLPKLRVPALIVNCGFAAVPVPLRVTEIVLPLVELLLMVSWPLADPVAVGSNCICTVIDWVGFSVVGRLWATIEKPVPEIAAEFTITGDVPDDVSVRD